MSIGVVGWNSFVVFACCFMLGGGGGGGNNVHLDHSLVAIVLRDSFRNFPKREQNELMMISGIKGGGGGSFPVSPFLCTCRDRGAQHAFHTEEKRWAWYPRTVCACAGLSKRQHFRDKL